MFSSDDALKALEEVSECEEKLNSAETKIYELVSTGVPKVSLNLPRLDPSWFLSDSSGRPSDQPAAYERSAAAEATVGSTDAVAPHSEDMEHLLVEHPVETAQQQFGDLLHRSRAWISGFWKELHALVSEHSHVLLTAMLAAVASVLMAAVFSFIAGGPILAALFSVFANFAGLAVNWSSRASRIFEVLHAAIDQIQEKLGGVLDVVGQQVSTPLEELHGVLDSLIAEQRPAVEKMQNFETTIRQVVPDFDIPTPDDLKQPLTECGTYVDRFVQQAKEALPEHFTEAVEQHAVGRLAVRRSSFNMWIIYAPLACILIANLGMCALMQNKRVSSTERKGTYQFNKQAEVLSTSLRSAFLPGSRAEWNLRGSLAALEGDTALPKTEQASGAGSGAVLGRKTKTLFGNDLEFMFGNSSHAADDGLRTISKSFVAPYLQKSQKQMAATLQPVLLQILFSFLQLLAGLILSRTPWVCAAANQAITSIETRLAERLDERTGEISEKIFGQAFSEVRMHADIFFPRFKLRLSQLRESLETISKAQNIVGRIGGMLGLGSAASGGA